MGPTGLPGARDHFGCSSLTATATSSIVIFAVLNILRTIAMISVITGPNILATPTSLTTLTSLSILTITTTRNIIDGY